MATTMSKYRRWAIVLCPVLLIALSGAVYFGPQIQVYLRMRRIVRPPSLWEVPRPLADTTVSPAPGTTLAYFGYRFEIPWVGIEKERGDGRWVKVLFKTGHEVFFANPDYVQPADVLLANLKEEPEIFRQAFGSHPVGSKYDHMKAVLWMTPSGLSPFRSRRNFAQDRLYLESKRAWVGQNDGPIDVFAIQHAGYQGFETSGISHDSGVEIALFDAAEREFVITVSRASSSAPKLTQAEINRVIQTFGPAPSGPPDQTLRK